MLDPRWIAMVSKTGRQSAAHVEQPVSFAKQQYAAVRCQSTAVKREGSSSNPVDRNFRAFKLFHNPREVRSLTENHALHGSTQNKR